MFTQLTKENLPTPNRLVIIKRIPNKIDPNPVYVGYRMNKPYEVSEDHSKYSNWYGSKVKELSKCAFGEKKFDSMFSDATVLEFCYLEDFINKFIVSGPEMLQLIQDVLKEYNRGEAHIPVALQEDCEYIINSMK